MLGHLVLDTVVAYGEFDPDGNSLNHNGGTLMVTRGAGRWVMGSCWTRFCEVSDQVMQIIGLDQTSTSRRKWSYSM